MAIVKRRVTIVAACCLLAAPLLAYAGSPADDLASYDWSATRMPTLATKPPPDGVVRAFVVANSANSEQLCSFQFADLRHSGGLSLVIDADSSGRKLCGSIYILDKRESEFDIYEGGASRGFQQLKGAIKDLAGDGNLELVLPTELTDYQEANYCMATWPVVYTWTGANYTNVSDRFPDFYRHELEELNQKIGSLAPKEGADTESYARDKQYRQCLEVEVAKIERILGDPEAGLGQAVALANSPDRRTRSFAESLLWDIATPEALEQLRKMSADPDKLIADEVQRLFANPDLVARKLAHQQRRGKYLIGPLGLTQFSQDQPVPFTTSK